MVRIIGSLENNPIVGVRFHPGKPIDDEPVVLPAPRRRLRLNPDRRPAVRCQNPAPIPIQSIPHRNAAIGGNTWITGRYFIKHFRSIVRVNGVPLCHGARRRSSGKRTLPRPTAVWGTVNEKRKAIIFNNPEFIASRFIGIPPPHQFGSPL